MNKLSVANKPISAAALRIVFAAGVFAAGGYYELCSALITIALCALLFFPGRGAARSFRPSPAVSAALLISLFYFLSAVWAVDSAMALWGGVKYLPVLLWAVCISAAEESSCEAVINDIPLLGAVTTVLSFALHFIPRFTDLFIVGGRLAGFFFYPNTFACFLLLGLQLSLFGSFRGPRWLRLLLPAVLGFGLALSASRAVIGLAVITLPAGLLISLKTRSVSGKESALSAAALAAGIVLAIPAALLPAFAVTGHLSSAAGGSTLYGRLLYWADAAPQILKNPFGMGYLGYYMSQASFQTGIYSVRWAHNDLVQLLLDVGWIPAGMLVYVLVRALLSKRISPVRRLMLFSLCAHSLFDFNLEFISMYALLFILMGRGEEKQRPLPRLLSVPAVLLCLFSVYVGIASTLTYSGRLSRAAELYPGNTLAESPLIFSAENDEELELRADSIIARNKKVSAAWQAKAICCYNRGDFSGFIRYEEKAISANPYELDLYEDYFRRLAIGAGLYADAGSSEGASVCLQKIHGISDMLEALRERTSPLAYKINDLPSFTLSPEYYEFTANNPIG